ncbi:hypothetical protein ILUMI_00930 [Ignelater luminosus]|uniref:Uncharacterized protein n=1 Tax=Ignelater luminosus TaxID=2038154 RepID=A0A8K0DJ98_IGNLU|nr:hypothetical protein ILUMI_00930 [Ignelater luminosus]
MITGVEQNNNSKQLGFLVKGGAESKHILKLKGKKQVRAVTSAERGALVTVVIRKNAADGFVPSMVICPRKNMKDELLNGAPPGTIAAFYVAEISEMPPHPHDVEHLRHPTPPRDLNPASFIKEPSCSGMSNPKNPRVKSQEISPLPCTSFYTRSDPKEKSRRESAALITGSPYKQI